VIVSVVRQGCSVRAGVGVYCAELLLSADNAPIGRHTVYVPQPVLTNVPYDTFTDEALLTYLRQLHRTPGYHVERTIEAINLADHRAELLQIDHVTPVLSIHALTTNEDQQPVQLILAYFNGERFKYQITI